MRNVMQQYYLEGAKLASAGLGLDADAFVQFAHQDETEESNAGTRLRPINEEKAVHWSGQASLESGDTGTRNEQMGLPRNGGV